MSSCPLRFKICICSFFFFFAHSAYAQLNRVKAGFLGYPSESAFAMGNIGFERLNKNKTSSLQIYYSIAGSSIPADAGDTKRKWFTAEKTFYIKSKRSTHFIYSFFIELGNRIKYPGFVHPSQDSIPQYTKSFELCPGAAAGFHHRFNKHWGIGLLTGPKLIFTNKQTNYYNGLSNKEFIVKEGNSVTAGLRFTPYICFQF
jgi:hypothetical protein